MIRDFVELVVEVPDTGLPQVTGQTVVVYGITCVSTEVETGDLQLRLVLWQAATVLQEVAKMVDVLHEVDTVSSDFGSTLPLAWDLTLRAANVASARAGSVEPVGHQ